MSRTGEVLKSVWGYDEFRPLQEEAIECILAGQDSLTVLPTGSGKSLCYQVPAILMNGMALVVSPLIALMKDQVDALNELGVEAACIHSGLDDLERRDIDSRIREGRVKLLYVAPERLTTPRFSVYLKRFQLSFVAIDEAHCISQWGHDFRPHYRELGGLCEKFPELGFHAFTATATTQVRDDICAQLHFNDSAVHVGGFDRPNLIYRVARREDTLTQCKEVIDRYPEDSGIIYCISRKQVDELTAQLIEAGFAATPYHAGLDSGLRRKNQEAFVREEVKIVVATVAFGMGIDKSNVRYVIHAGVPKSIEHYQQESGRAGRDGLEAECLLLHSGRDINTWKMMLRDLEGEAYDVALQKLNHMQSYISTSRCRHAELVQYFGHKYLVKNCGACDVCLGEIDLHPEAASVAKHILNAVKALGQVAGTKYATLVLTGSREQRVLDKGHHELPFWGALSGHSPKEIRDWIEQMVQQNFLQKTGEYNILELAPEAHGLEVGTAEVKLHAVKPRRVSPPRSKVSEKSWEGVDKDLFEVLRKVRMEFAGERSVPAYIIFGDAPLRDMARKCPVTLHEFLDVQGVGEKKADAYGERFVESIRDYMEAKQSREPEGGARRVVPKNEVAVAPRKTKTRESAYELFEAGRTVSDVAMELARTPSYVYKFLESYIIQRGITEPYPWVSEESYREVVDAIAALGRPKEAAIHQHLDGRLAPEEIRIAMVCLRNKEFG